MAPVPTALRIVRRGVLRAERNVEQGRNDGEEELSRICPGPRTPRGTRYRPRSHGMGDTRGIDVALRRCGRDHLGCYVGQSGAMNGSPSCLVTENLGPADRGERGNRSHDRRGNLPALDGDRVN